MRDAGFIKNLNKESVEEIESAYKKLIDPNFFVNKWCMSCVAEMMRILYVATKFDEQSIVVEIIVQQEPEQEQPIVEQEIKAQIKKRGRKKKN